MKLKEKRFTGSTSNEVTARETEHRKMARKAAAEGFVLLQNEGNLLPLKATGKIGLYGAGAVKTIKGGTGSGDVNERDCVTIRQGMEQAGFDITSGEWLDSYQDIYTRARQTWKDDILKKIEQFNGNFFAAYSTTPFFMPCGNVIDEAAAKNDDADTAVFVLARIAGENADRKEIEGDYYISAEEKTLLDQISNAYENIILIINTGGSIDLAFVEEFSKIKSIIQFVQAGQEGGSALADVLAGAITPSGKMTDTWTLQYSDYPNAATFSHKNGNTDIEKYEEGLYVGYRYFDTFDVPVRYCFGYGLSYTNFAIETKAVKVLEISSENPKIQVETAIKNTGAEYAGKEVVQVYVSCPQGSMPKEYRRLVGFAKTTALKPGQTESLSIEFPLYQLTSYREEDAAWVLEAGAYGIWVGNSLHDAKLAGSIIADQETVMVKGGNICKRQEELTELQPDAAKIQAKEAVWLKETAQLTIAPVTIRVDQLQTKEVHYQDGSESFTGRAGEIVEELSEEQLIQMATGDPGKGQGNALGSAGVTVPGAAAETSSAAGEEPWNAAGMVLADGPAGLRLHKKYQVVDGEIVQESFLSAFEGGFFAPEAEQKGTPYYQYCTAIPVGTLLAQTWNTKLMREIGEMIGHEMEEFRVTLWLAPGMNIHRNPLCGRNFEYYSEDPVLSGIMAAAMTDGVQKVPGCGTTIKHFACNNQEDNRMGSDSVVSERVLREIYLKGFEIAVKTAQPMSIMTSYNMINGVHAANSYDLCTKAARDEWGFAGTIMTDWTTTTDSTRGECTAAGCIRAGNDLVMPGVAADHENLRAELKAGTLSKQELKLCVYRTIKIVQQSNQYEEAVGYSEQFK